MKNRSLSRPRNARSGDASVPLASRAAGQCYLAAADPDNGAERNVRSDSQLKSVTFLHSFTLHSKLSPALVSLDIRAHAAKGPLRKIPVDKTRLPMCLAEKKPAGWYGSVRACDVLKYNVIHVATCFAKGNFEEFS
jgi:hypothetical protein